MRKTSTRLPEQGTQTPSPAPDLIPAETNNQPRTHIAIGTANGGTSRVLTLGLVQQTGALHIPRILAVFEQRGVFNRHASLENSA